MCQNRAKLLLFPKWENCPKMGIYVHLFSFMIVVVTTFVRTTVVYTTIDCLSTACARVVVYCACVRDCLLRARARHLMQGLIGVLSLGNLSRKPRCNALSLNDLHLCYLVEIGWLLFFVLSLVASNVKA
jgi:hypothetical protein